jgi:hypothetical protein
MKRDIWGIFHDGVLTRLLGSVPGRLNLHVEIEYLRQMFDEPGGSFTIELEGCSKFRYTEHDEQPTEDLSKLNMLEPEVLYIASENPLVLDCAGGTLELEYNSMRVTLPSGSEVSYESLVSASEKYWNEWSKRAGGKA